MLKQLVLIFYLLCFSIGIGAIVFFVLVDYKLRSRIIRQYLILFFVFNVYVLMLALKSRLDQFVPTDYNSVYLIMALINYVLYLIFFNVAPRLFHHIYHINYSHSQMVYWILSGLLALTVFYIVFTRSDSLQIYKDLNIVIFYVLNPILFIILMYLIILHFAFKKQITNARTKRYMRTAFIVVIVFYPGLALDLTKHKFPNSLNFPEGYIFIVIFILIWNLANIVFLSIYFKKYYTPPEIEKFPPSFLKEYKLKRVEKDIIMLYIQQIGVERIAYRQLLSVHVTNKKIDALLQRFGVSSSKELSDFIKSYESR